MKYLLLVYHNEEGLGRLSESELGEMRNESVGLANQLNATGHYLSAAPLQPSATAKCVRVRDGARLVTDGPFAETREHIGGYFLVTAKDVSEAMEIAARIPGARIGTVEIRALTELP